MTNAGNAAYALLRALDTLSPRDVDATDMSLIRTLITLGKRLVRVEIEPWLYAPLHMNKAVKVYCAYTEAVTALLTVPDERRRLLRFGMASVVDHVWLATAPRVGKIEEVLS